MTDYDPNLDLFLPPVTEAGEPVPKPRYTVRNAAFALQPLPPVDPVVKGLINRGDLVIPYGESGSKKTYSMISLAVCVANGKKWLDFETYKTRVLIIDEESGERRLSRRLAESIRGEVCGEDTDLLFVSLANFKLDDANDAAILQALIEECQAGLVIIDALADIMDGDENSKQDTQPVFSALRKIADSTNAAIIVIHHSNKTGGYRGSSAIKGAVELMIEVKSEDGSPFVSFRTVKMRDIEAKTWTARAVWTDDQFYLSAVEKGEGQKPLLDKAERYVIRYLAEHPGALVSEIMDAADTTTAEGARRAVYRLAEKEYVRRANTGGRGQGAAYELTDRGRGCDL